MRNKIVLLPFDEVPRKCFDNYTKKSIISINRTEWNRACNSKLYVEAGELAWHRGFACVHIIGDSGNVFFWTFIDCVDFKNSELSEDFLLLCANYL